MADVETDLEKTQAKAEGLARWFRERLVSGLNKLLVAVLLVGGILSTATTHHLAPALVSLSVGVAITLLMIIRTLLILRALRRHPAKEVARLTKRRRLIKAGFSAD